MNAQVLLKHFDRISDAPDAVSRLKQFVLDLAMRGKLVPQDQGDEPAVELLKRINIKRRELMEPRGGPISAKPIEAGQPPYEVPDTWMWIRLSDGFEYDAGVKREPSDLVPDRWLLELEDIEKDTSKILARLRVRDRDSLSTKSEFQIGDILYGKLRPYLNKVVVAHEVGYSTTEIVAIRPFLPLCSAYCTLALRRTDFVQYVTQLGRGTKMPRLRTPDAVSALFPLPPLGEQSRIVAKVDELMVLCDRLEKAQKDRETRRDMLSAASHYRLANDKSDYQNLDNNQFFISHLSELTTSTEQVKQLRHCVLNLAVRGRLVPQDSTDEPALDLLRRILKTSLTSDGRSDSIKDRIPFAIPSSWQWVPFGRIIIDADAGWSPRSESFPRSGREWGVIKVSAVSWDRFLPEENKQLLPGIVPPVRAQIHAGDFLISRANTSDLVAKCVVVEQEPERLILSDKIVRLQLANCCEKRFLCIINNSADYARAYYAEEASGTSHSMKNVSRAVIYALPIPLPPLSEQHRILSKVDEIMSVCDRLEEALSAKRTDTSTLLNSVLQEALNVRSGKQPHQRTPSAITEHRQPDSTPVPSAV